MISMVERIGRPISERTCALASKCRKCCKVTDGGAFHLSEEHQGMSGSHELKAGIQFWESSHTQLQGCLLGY